MRFARAGVALLSTLALGVGSLSLAIPAQAEEEAEEPRPSTTTFEISPATRIYWGSKQFIARSTTTFTTSTGTPRYVDSGSVELLGRAPGESEWTTLATEYHESSVGTAMFSPLPATHTMWVKAVYGGGTSYYFTDERWERTSADVAPSESEPVKVTVAPLVRTKWVRGTKLRVTIEPTYKRKPVILRSKKGKKFVVWKRAKTNSKSRVVFKLPAVPDNPRKIQKFKLTVPKTPTLAKYEQRLSRPYFY